MGLHLCPIEPDDWANGPGDDPYTCSECEGSGCIEKEDGTNEPCANCDGQGFTDPPDPEPDMSDFI